MYLKGWSYAYTDRVALAKIITNSDLLSSVHRFRLKYLNPLANSYRDDVILVKVGEINDSYVKLCVS